MYEEKISDCHSKQVIPALCKAKKKGDVAVILPICPICKKTVLTKNFKFRHDHHRLVWPGDKGLGI
jgi:hypothetical protein